MIERPHVPCSLCGTPTPYTGTKRCNRCWELESRIQAAPVLAEKILKHWNAQLLKLAKLAAKSQPD